MSSNTQEIEYVRRLACGKALYLELVIPAASLQPQEQTKAGVFQSVTSVLRTAGELERLKQVIVKLTNTVERESLTMCHIYMHYKTQRRYAKLVAIFDKAKHRPHKIVTHTNFNEVYNDCTDVAEQWPSTYSVSNLYDTNDSEMGIESNQLTRAQLLKKIKTLQHQNEQLQHQKEELQDEVEELQDEVEEKEHWRRQSDNTIKDCTAEHQAALSARIPRMFSNIT
jgi:gas vesicle protein